MNDSNDSEKINSLIHSRGSVADNVTEPSRGKMYKQFQRTGKSLEELNLMDAYLFGASTENPKHAEFIGKLIVERATGRKLDEVIVESEKAIRGIDTLRRGVRLDLRISELDDKQIATIYDIEPNNYDLAELPWRDRYYQAVSDAKILKKRQEFRKLPQYVSIWILPQDPFGDDRMLYTVKNVVVENTNIVYNDGVMKLFLNAKGKKGGNKALAELLEYFASSKEDNAVDADLTELHNIVTEIKHNKEVGERYMTIQDMIDYEKRDSYNEGVACGKELGEKLATEEAITVLIRTCKSFGKTKEDIVNVLMQEYAFTEEEAVSRVEAYEEV